MIFLQFLEFRFDNFFLLFHHCWDRSKITVLLCASRSTCKRLSATFTVESSKRKYSIFSDHCVRARLRAMLHLLPPWHETFALDSSTRLNEHQSGSARHGQILTMAEIKLRGCAGVAATGGTRRAHHFIHVEHVTDSKNITWAPSIPCGLLSRPHVSRLGNLHTLSSETQELRNVPLQCPCALTWVLTILAFFNGGLCALLQATRLSST